MGKISFFKMQKKKSSIRKNKHTPEKIRHILPTHTNSFDLELALISLNSFPS